MEIYFTKEVIKKVGHPDTSQFRLTWSELCKWTHATVFSSQLDLTLRDSEHEASLNFTIIEIFLECTYHLLARHIITPTVRYYGERYANENKGVLAMKRIHESFKRQSQFYGPAARKLIRDYKAVWKVT